MSLYANRASPITSDSSHIEFDRVFCGQFWDEFSACGFFGSGQESASVLMLGLAEGGAIRPILARNPDCRLTCVDNDSYAVSRCRDLYRDHFPYIDFETVCEDAHAFLVNSIDQYTAIIVDLYTSDAASPLLYSEKFHRNLKSVLKPGGVVVLNCYGVPMHLAPFSGRSPQRTLAEIARRHWRDVSFLPHRRNALFVLGDDGHGMNATPSSADLKLGDQLFLRVMQARLRAMPAVPALSGEYVEACWTFTEIDQEMRRRWMAILPRFSTYLDPSAPLAQPAELRDILGKPDLCRAIQDRLYDAGDELSLLLPILTAGEINTISLDASWLPEWVISKMLDPDFTPDGHFLGYILPQALAVVLHGSRRYQAYVFSFAHAFDQLERRAAPCPI